MSMLRPTTLLAVAMSLVLGALGGFAFAQDPPNTYTGCLGEDGQLKSLAIGDTPLKKCGNKETPVSWGEEGPPGEQGPPGVLQFYHVAVGGRTSGNVGTATASCEAGDAVVGGGVNTLLAPPGLEFSPDSTILGSHPGGSQNWVGSVAQTGEATARFGVFAICADMTP